METDETEVIEQLVERLKQAHKNSDLATAEEILEVLEARGYKALADRDGVTWRRLSTEERQRFETIYAGKDPDKR